MTPTEALGLAHAEILATLAPRLTARRSQARQYPNSSAVLFLAEAEAFAAGVDHAFAIAHEHLAKLARLEAFETPPQQTPLFTERRPA